MWDIIYSALINTKNIFTSIVGNRFFSNFFDSNSEMNKSNWDFMNTLKFISDIFIIKIPLYCPKWVPYSIRIIFFGDNSRYYADNEESQNGECMIFLNGILYNDITIKQTQSILKNMFNRPINILKNASDSIISDIIESLVGKFTQELDEASTIALYTICNKLLDEKIDKLIIICHSQGSIIMSNVLKNLYKLGLNKQEYMKKLEIYSFATCATKMNYVVDELPYMEHFANDNDFVANLGCNCADDIKHLITIDGKINIKRDKSGHMFNTHYINNFSNDFPESKLLTYVKNE
tara:strand:- start:986 stop:1861 length:876 start_codon:yes stop_codon:yes gene_type:complete